MMSVFDIVDIPTWITATVVTVTSLCIYGYYPMRTWKSLGVPGPPSLPFIGNVHQFLNPKTGIRASVTQWQEQYGKVFGIQFFRKPCLVVTDASLFSQILVKEFNTYHDRYILGGEFIPKPVLDGLAFQTGSDWKRNRSIITPTFTTGKIKLLTGYMNQTAHRLADKLESNANTGAETKAKDVFSAFSLDVIAGTAFGLDLDSQSKEDGGFYDKVERIFKTTKVFKLAMALAGMFPFTGYFLKTMNVSLFEPESIEYFRKFLGKLVEERKRNPDQFKQWDFFQLLLNAEGDEETDMTSEKKLKQEEIVCHGITFIMAGFETTSSTLQFLSHILAHDHSIQHNLAEEMKEVFDGPETEVSYEHCTKLKYMESVLLETLRMYPPIHQVKREAVKDTVLNGMRVPKNAGILIPVYNVGRDPDLFPDPDTFRPVRFMTDEGTRSIHFLPFGFGPRQCIGMRLALVEMKIALVHILRKVRIENAEPKDMDLEDYTGFLTPRQPFRLTLKAV